jgi:hypothetical protein
MKMGLMFLNIFMLFSINIEQLLLIVSAASATMHSKFITNYVAGVKENYI